MGGVPIYEAPTIGFDEIAYPKPKEKELYGLIIRDVTEATSEFCYSSPSKRINAHVADAHLYLYQ